MIRSYLSLWHGELRFLEIPKATETMREIAERIAAIYDLRVQDLKSQSTLRRHAWPRQHAMAEMYDSGNFSLNQIGSYLGGRDHSTILHGVRAHTKRTNERVDDRICHTVAQEAA